MQRKGTGSMENAKVYHANRKQFCTRMKFSEKKNHLLFYSNRPLHYEEIEFFMLTVKTKHGRHHFHYIGRIKAVYIF